MSAERAALSVIMIALNEADRLPRALASVSWADQIVLVDSGSQDGTPTIARRMGAEVAVHAWEGYSRQKAFALGLARHAWVLWIDADEEVTPELRRSIEAALGRAGDPPEPVAFAMNRRTQYLGKPLRFGGWYPDRKVRLFHREHARFDDRLVHEELQVDGPVGYLRGDLMHYSYRDVAHHVRKIQHLAELWAADQGPRPVARWELVVHPAAKALKSYFLRAGFLEGWRGLVLAGLSTYYVWLKYALLRERGRRGGASRSGGCCPDKEAR
jgi:(heptosyl)LPS beta-1,4-glucosyltransferase